MLFSLELFKCSVYILAQSCCGQASHTWSNTLKYIYSMVKYTMQFTVVVLTQWRLRIIYCRYTSRWRTEPSFFCSNAQLGDDALSGNKGGRSYSDSLPSGQNKVKRFIHRWQAACWTAGVCYLLCCRSPTLMIKLWQLRPKLQWFWKRDGCWW